MSDNADIVICMGSSCFARGNRALLPVIERFLRERGLQERVTLSGSRCEDLCADGPTVVVHGQRYQHVDEGMLLDVLAQHFPKQ